MYLIIDFLMMLVIAPHGIFEESFSFAEKDLFVDNLHMLKLIGNNHEEFY